MKYAGTVAVGVTGGIGGGKSEACRIFEDLGARVISADAMARNIVDTDPAVKRGIRKLAGDRVYGSDGRLDRKQMAAVVFRDARVRDKLNGIVHPRVLEILRKEIRNAKASAEIPAIFVEAALIYEARADSLFDFVVVVDAPEEVRLERISKRDGIDTAEARRRISSQLSSEEKVSRADFVIQNHNDMRTLREGCKFLYHLMTRLSTHFSPAM